MPVEPGREPRPPGEGPEGPDAVEARVAGLPGIGVVTGDAGAGGPVVVEAVLRASRVLVAVAARSLADVADEVTLPQYRALVVIASKGPQRVASLADALEVTPSTATRMCDRLVRKGLVRRRTAPADRRAVRLYLTTEGHELVVEVTRRRRAEIVKLLERVSPASQGALVELFGAFADAAGEPSDGDWALGWEL